MFEVGELVKFDPSPSSGERFDMHRRGNCVGVIIDVAPPFLGVTAMYLYKIHYQNHWLHWEAEENLVLLISKTS
jgi:hypothetical protein